MSLDTIIEELGKLQVNSSTDSNIPSTSTPISQGITSNYQIKFNHPLLNNLVNMAFKPEYLSCVPQFDGNPSELNRYLSTCESIITTFYDRQNVNNFQNKYILNSLISKLSGNAKSVVNIQNCSNWEELKTTLHRNFADQRDEACLNRDLVLLRQNPNEKVNHFYDRILEILNLLCCYVDIHEETAESKQLKRELYTNLALKTFICGLKEPLGSIIRCMRPRTLEEAMQFIRDEENTHYFQNLTNKPIPRPNPPQNQFNPVHQIRNFERQQQFNRLPNNSNYFNVPNNSNYFKIPNNFNNPSNFNNPINFQSRPFPSQPINIQPQYVPPRRLPTNSEVFGRPQQQNNSNVFRPNPNRPLPTPTPMSINSRLSSNPSLNRSFQQRNSNVHPIIHTSQPSHRSDLHNTNIDIIPETSEPQVSDFNCEESFDYDGNTADHYDENDQDISGNFHETIPQISED